MSQYNAGTSSALHNGVTWKRLMRIERAVQLQASGLYNDSDIAQQIGVTPAHYSLIKQTPEFKTRMISAASGVIAQNDIAIKTDREYQAEFIKAQVPVALEVVAKLMLSKDQRVAIKAASELLDRDGVHVKVSKSEIKVKDDGVDRSKNDRSAIDIMAILKGQAPPSHDAITNVMDEFTKGAMDADAQIDSNSALINEETLEAIDKAKVTIN